MADPTPAHPPDLDRGVLVNSLEDGGTIAGTVGEDDVLLVRSGDEYFAISPKCTHYGAALSGGLVVGDTIRCPLHHACFSLRSGEALRAPAFESLSRWRVERQGDRIFVRDKVPASPVVVEAPAPGPDLPVSVVIIGGGAAGFAAAEMLRRDGYPGPVTIISADESAPYDRPNLSKDYLAGDMQDDWMPLQSAAFYTDHHIDLVLGATVASIDVTSRRVHIEGGASRDFGALLIATGADPIHLPIPGADSPRVRYVRSMQDGRAIVERLTNTKSAVVVGASFIGLEVASALRARDIEVHVAAPERVPLERVFGREIGGFVRRMHESRGVVFHLGDSVARIDDRRVTLTGGTTLDADIVIMGVGVRPSVSLAEKAGLAIDRGVVVNEFLETSVPGIFAAGDIARWPDRHSGDRIRVEHWVVAERQGQIAAKNILGRRVAFDTVPFFWTRQYDTSIRYVGHADTWDAVTIDGSLEGAETDGCTVTYRRGDRTLAVATIGRALESLRTEAAME